jgi:hypothetical protein
MLKIMKLFNKFALLVGIFSILSFSASAQEIGGVKGKVRTPRGNTIAEVKVTARQDDKDVKSTVTNKKGEFVLDGLKAGKYSFTFYKSGYSSGTLHNVEVGKNKIRDLGSRLVLDIDEGTLVIVKGSVFNQDGRSIYGAKIDIGQVLGDGSVKKLDSKYSSESGEFTFRFSEGTATYRVTASLNGKTATKDVTVEMAAIYRLALTLDFSGEKKNDDPDN